RTTRRARSSSADAERETLEMTTAVVLAAWFAVVLWAGSAGAFEASRTRPPLALLLAVVGPPLAFFVAYRTSRPVRELALGLDPRWPTAVQGWRVIGVTFLVLYAYGLLPGVFAWPAGVGDMAVGLAAPFVTLAVIRRTPTWRRQVAWLNIAGLVDFAGAV